MSHEGIRKTNLLQKLLNIRGERFLLILTDHAEKKGFAENQLKLHILNWLNGFLQRDEQRARRMPDGSSSQAGNTISIADEHRTVKQLLDLLQRKATTGRKNCKP